MFKTITLSFLGFLLLATPVLAASVQKYTFNDVNIEGIVVEIEASVKSGKNPYSTCSYFSDNYVSYLGMYGVAVKAGPDASSVLNFCVTHYPERVL